MKIVSQNYYCKDENDRNLFSIELASIEGFPWLTFYCTLGIDFAKFPELQKMIDEICFLGTNEQKREELMEDFFTSVVQLEGIEKSFFKSEENIKQSQLTRSIVWTLDNIFNQEDFCEYTPFSKNRNSYFFYVLRKKFSMPEFWNDVMEVEKECFESLIKGKVKLENEYVELYSTSATFFIKGITFEGLNYEFYFMKTDKIDLIFFIEA